MNLAPKASIIALTVPQDRPLCIVIKIKERTERRDEQLYGQTGILERIEDTGGQTR